MVDKIGIAFDLESCARLGEYTEIWWKRELSRAQCWGVEQIALDQTRQWTAEKPYFGKGDCGPTEQRTGWVLDDVIQLLERLCTECEELGLQAFYSRYMEA